jgi:hypothetical protein
MPEHKSFRSRVRITEKSKHPAQPGRLTVLTPPISGTSADQNMNPNTKDLGGWPKGWSAENGFHPTSPTTWRKTPPAPRTDPGLASRKRVDFLAEFLAVGCANRSKQASAVSLSHKVGSPLIGSVRRADRSNATRVLCSPTRNPDNVGAGQIRFLGCVKTLLGLGSVVFAQRIQTTWYGAIVVEKMMFQSNPEKQTTAALGPSRK